MLRDLDIDVVTIPRSALFLAGKAYLRYRGVGGSRTGVLSDFFIGAHAAVEQRPLLTRDARRYRTYFPTVELITPSESGE
jgi:predicted nucleic acid-binding protein